MTSSHPTVLQELEGDSAWLVRVSRRLLQRADDAEDMVQEASVRAILSERDGRGVDEGRVRPWLAQTVKRLSWDANRREAVRATTQLTDAVEGEELDPAEAMERAEFRSTIAALVMGLPEAERQGIVLRYYEGLNTAEIMKVTGAPSQDAVRQRISRGIAKLRLQLDDDLGAREWRRSALAFCPAALTGTSATRWVLVALLLAAGGVMTATALWGDGNPLTPPADLAAAMTPAIEATEENSIAALTQAKAERGAAGETPTAGPETAAAGPELLIQLIDGATGAPVADQPWFALRTGEHDYGRAWGFASKEPNPRPIASGITGPDGMARFPLPDDVLINLCTERSERFARGSWAIRIEDGEALPSECELSDGTTIRGRVVDDVGEPVAGLLLQTPSFTDEWLPLGTTDETGAFELPRCADFPRSFVIREDNKVEPSRTLPTDVTVMDGPVAVAYLSPMAGGVESKVLANTVISRGLRLSGTVRDAQRQPVKGALVSTYYPRVNLAKSAAKYDRQPLPFPWHAEGFELQQGEALTDASGHFTLEVHPRRQRPAELDLVAYSPDGAMEILSLTGLESGEERSDLRFELDGSETVRLRLVPASQDDGPLRWDGNPDRAVTLIWDASKDPAAPRPPDRVTAIAGPDVALPHQHLPDRSLYGGRLVGTLDLPGYRAARITLDAGVHEATVPLEPVPKVHLRLEVTGADADFLTGATVKVTPEPPAESLTDEKNFRRGSSRSLIQTHAYGWQNGETVPLDLKAGEQAYVYVMLFGGTARAQRALPPIGPLELTSTTAESPFVVRTRIDSWPERERKDRPALKEGESAAVVARRPAAVVARLVDQDTGDFLEEATAVSVDSAHRHYGRQRISNGEKQPLRLESSMEQLTVRFTATGYKSRIMGPLALSPGSEVDLGTIELEPLQEIQCTLLRPDGSPTTGVHVLSWTDSGAGWTRVKSSEEGVAVLFTGHDLPDWIKVKAREGSNDPEQLLKPVRTGPHTCTLEVPYWRRVRLRVDGVGAPWCYGVERIRFVGLSPAVGVDPIGSTIWWPRFDGDALVFDTRLPPGKWTVKPSTPEFVTFPDTAIWIDEGAAPGADPGVDSEAAPVEFTVRATVTVR